MTRPFAASSLPQRSRRGEASSSAGTLPAIPLATIDLSEAVTRRGLSAAPEGDDTQATKTVPFKREPTAPAAATEHARGHGDEDPSFPSDAAPPYVTLGKYQLLRHLASGETCHVFLARRDAVGGFARHLVVKTLRRSLAGEPAQIARFLEEARLLAALHHSNIVQVFDIGLTSDGIHYLAMEYVHGQSVRAVLTRASERGLRLPLEFGLSVGYAAAAAAHHIHTRCRPDGRPLEIIHRALAPSNLMVGYDGSLKLIDFGLAWAAERPVHTPVGVRLGKLEYLAPEQASGQPVDQRSDQFSLAVLLYELSTQRHPFAASSVEELRQRILRAEVRAPSTVLPGYPRPLERVLLKALSRRPDDRYADCAAFATALSEVAAELKLGLHPQALVRVLHQLWGPQLEPWYQHGGEPGAPAKPEHPAPARRTTARFGAPPTGAPPRAPRAIRAPELLIERPAPPAPQIGAGSSRFATPMTAAPQLAAPAPAAPAPDARPAAAPPLPQSVWAPGQNLPMLPSRMPSCTPAPFDIAMPLLDELAGLAPAVSQMEERAAPPEWSTLDEPLDVEPWRWTRVLHEAAELALASLALALLLLQVVPVASRQAPAPPAPPAVLAPAPLPVALPTPAAELASVPPIPEQPARRLLLSVESKPRSAIVLLDGERLGRTPLITTVPARDGTGTLRVRKRGYRPRTFELQFYDDTSLQVTLQRRPDAEQEAAPRTDPDPARPADTARDAAEGEVQYDPSDATPASDAPAPAPAAQEEPATDESAPVEEAALDEEPR